MKCPVRKASFVCLEMFGVWTGKGCHGPKSAKATNVTDAFRIRKGMLSGSQLQQATSERSGSGLGGGKDGLGRLDVV